MDKFTFSLKNILDGEGIGISLTGMLIVFSALSLIAIFIKVLPWILDKLSPYLPKGEVLHTQPAEQSRVSSGMDESLAAAIGYALYKKQLSDK
jgi:Na+-transporting methylmalonyl-CoA/oxaloacetate decarboxylase gamma subunit